MAARVRLPPMDNGSSAGGSRVHTLSRTGTDDLDDAPSCGALLGESRDDLDDLLFDPREIVRRLEEIQAKQVSLQQPSPELDSLLARVLAGRPELRPRLAVMTKSALIRKKILAALPQGSRAVGSGATGSTHPWRQERLPDSFTDHNWPKATMNNSGLHFLPGGNETHSALLRSPADKLRKNPLMSHSSVYSVPKAKRFPCAKEQADGQHEVRCKQPPGPGTYHKSVPRGTAFSNDGGETVVLGANHACPWKGSLGRQINPIDVDFTTCTTAPCFSFSKSRRTVSETSVGHSSNSVKSDFGNLSPGCVYEHFSSFDPITGPSHSRKQQRHSQSMPSFSRVRPVRMVPCPPEPQTANIAA